LAREHDSDRLSLDQEIEGSNPSSPANIHNLLWSGDSPTTTGCVGAGCVSRPIGSMTDLPKSGALDLNVKRPFVRLTLSRLSRLTHPDSCA
jgi:hypothetical protein